jgi:hypothetical protein
VRQAIYHPSSTCNECCNSNPIACSRCKLLLLLPPLQAISTAGWPCLLQPCPVLLQFPVLLLLLQLAEGARVSHLHVLLLLPCLSVCSGISHAAHG